MSRLNELCTKLASFPGALVTLTLANVVTFWSHYRGDAQFPWDFPMSYYGFVAYWTTAVSHGVLPEWMPFQEMGYPFFANLQTGITYPPLWFFPLSGVVYTMHAAVIFQVLHVLWGAIGAYALGRSRFSPIAALLLGMSYHFFGGFYGNAQHPDIVRAFAWLPWLLLSVQILPGQTKLALRNLAIPLVVMCVVTGSYPGNVASHLLVAGVTVLGALLGTPRPRAVL
ncbi:MAG: hypothetical protein JNM74_05915, partial [Myxococcales bacterium]|nr:hypothetical protein [Myxococcales bacterium]